VFLTGLVRCGSSWAGQVLSAGRGCRFVYEPFNPGWTPRLRGHWRQFSYLTKDDTPPAPLLRTANAAFAGRQALKLHARAAYRGYLWQTLRPARQVLIKDPTACLASVWLHQAFRPQMLLITRHPCGFASSIRLHGWSARLQALLRQPRLLEDHLGPYEALMRRADRDDWQRLGAFWAAVHLVLRHWWRQHPEWTWSTYEALCSDPRAEFTRLAARIGLELSDQALVATLNADAGSESDSCDTRRDSQRMAEVWKERMSAGQIDAVMGVVREFGFDAYPLDMSQPAQSS
jgi:hypothetical protein